MSKYLPLESNPDMLTSFIRSLGVASPARFIDVWSFDEEMLFMFPQPILAVCVLYPGSKVDELRKSGLTILPPEPKGSQCFYIRQRGEDVGNACGTIAVIHSVANNLDQLILEPESPFLKFCQQSSLNAEQLADELNKAEFLHAATTVVASEGQTATPDAEDEVDSHFIAFVRNKASRLVELDGQKPGPVDHGVCAPEEVFAKALRIVREDLMTKDPGNVNFCVLALTTGPEQDD